MKKLTIEINVLDYDPSMGHSKALMPVDFPAQGIYQYGVDLFFVNETMVTVHMLDDPHWLEIFCSPDESTTALPKNLSENFILKLIAVTQHPELAEQLTLEK